MKRSRCLLIAAAWLVGTVRPDELETSFREPPPSARTRCWWWWLNGNVDADAIARDLREMQRHGMGGAAIIDADGSAQDGHRRVPAGPRFASDEWLRLFRFALDEASRYGFEMSLNIMSGWNLGGPHVRPEDSTRRLVWSEVLVEGGGPRRTRLPRPPGREGVCDDVAIVAVRWPAAGQRGIEVRSSADSPEFPVGRVVDGDPKTFWVAAAKPGAGPAPTAPVWLEVRLPSPVRVDQIAVLPRPRYGPRDGRVEVVGPDGGMTTVAVFTNASETDAISLRFPTRDVAAVRLLVTGAWDPRSPQAPRNVQVAEIELFCEGRRLRLPADETPRIRDFEQKAYHRYPGPFNAPPAEHLVRPEPTLPGEAVPLGEVVVLAPRWVEPDVLEWAPPAGRWRLFRFCSTLAGSHVSTCSEGWAGWAVDHLDPAMVDAYWREVVERLLAAGGPHVGRTWAAIQTDSWELGPINWTRAMPREFRQRRGYDLEPWLPALAGVILDSRERSNRFLADFRRTLGDLFAEHVRRLAELARSRGLKLQAETGGPHAAPIDALQTMGICDFPTGEFWIRNDRHRVEENFRFFIKQGASAAHIYGRPRMQAESFTSIGPHWEQAPRDLKHDLDRAFCEGLNHVMLHTLTCSPASAGLPGQEYFAGTHFNPNVTWWPRADGFFAYVHHAQALLQAGRFVADVLHYYGDHVPNFVRLREDNPAGVWPDYDYDVINEEALRTRVSAKDGRIILPDGMSYRLLSLPSAGVMSLEALRVVERLVEAGVPVVGPRPVHRTGLSGGEAADREFAALAERLWGGGRISTNSPRAELARLGIEPDVIVKSLQPNTWLDRIHRRTDTADVYFIVNRWTWRDVLDTKYRRRFDLPDRYEEVECSFRVRGRVPELWDPLTGTIEEVALWREESGRTVVPLRLPPEGSVFVVFRRPSGAVHPVELWREGERIWPSSEREPRSWPVARLSRSDGRLWLDAWVAGRYEVRWSDGRVLPVEVPPLPPPQRVGGEWVVRFLDGRGAPATVKTEQLFDWTTHPDEGVRFYAGRAVYETNVPELPRQDGLHWTLDLGQLHEIGGVWWGERDLGTLWTAPYRTELPDAEGPAAVPVKLRVEVINSWANRLIGDAKRPLNQRVTRTNITKFERVEATLRPSGLLGPVELRPWRRVRVGEPPHS
ncbi:MAG: glycosyl hydrolase [Kiritimatiellae bacterium]|nr:glycosyl hydrolase [Kiritimatiellia bacterium]